MEEPEDKDSLGDAIGYDTAIAVITSANLGICAVSLQILPVNLSWPVESLGHLLNLWLLVDSRRKELGINLSSRLG